MTGRDPKPRILLLAAQALALGLTAAWITVSATAIFLESFGADSLPVTYIGAAVTGAVTTALLTRTLRTRPLSKVAVRVLTLLVVLLLASWLLLSQWDATWVSYVVLVLLPIIIPVGFMFIVGQAGMLLDVRILKSSYPRVIAGFAAGFFAGAFVGPLLLAVYDTVDLLIAAAFAASAFLALVIATWTAFPAELSKVEQHTGPQQRPTIRSLTRNRFVVLIMAFQMLSALESQWLDFLTNDRIAARYSSTAEVASFLSRVVALAYGINILFLLLVAGVLLRRFGLRYGLAADPGVVLVLLVAMIVATLAAGSGATVVFVLVIATRISDLTLADGATRASLGAAYQAVPTAERTAAQAFVEGLGVPVAIGFSGVVLMIVRATVGTGGLALPVLTGVVVLIWGVVAVFVYRGYRVSLLENLRHRVLDPTELTLDEASGLEVIDRLLASDDLRDVRVGLDALNVGAHPEMTARLVQLATGGRVAPRVEALGRLVSIEPTVAHDVALAGLGDASPEVRAASLRALSSAGGLADVAAVTVLTHDADDDVKVAAFAALTRLGDDETHRSVSAELAACSTDADPHRRVLAARVLEECDAADGIDRRPLRELLDDPVSDVVNAALAAIGDDDVGLLGLVVLRLDDTRTAGDAVEALVRAGDAGLAVADEGLDGRLGLGRRPQELLARVCRQRGGPAAAPVLQRHVTHPDREVGLAVMTALAALGPAVDGAVDSAFDDVVTALVRDELVRAAHVLQLLQAAPASGALGYALHDELTLTRRRLLAALSIRYGTEGIGRVTFQLATHDAHTRGLAIEWLEVTLVPTDKPAIALLDPNLSDEERLRALSRVASGPASGREPIVVLPEAVIDLVEDRDRRWHCSWLVGSALVTASELPDIDFDGLVARMPHDDRPAGWSDVHELVPETISGIRHRRGTGDLVDPAVERSPSGDV